MLSTAQHDGNGAKMTYIVNENCIKCKLTDCVEVCPMDCFHEGENMLVIDPDTCIDCGVCVPECPLDAITSDAEPGQEKWVAVNAAYAKSWPVISAKREPLPTSKEWEGVRDKFEHHFSPKPGAGD